MEEDGIYTKDRTVDIHNNPANKITTGNWKACCFILGNESCERLAYYGLSTNLVNYLQQRLTLGNVDASNAVTNWSGTCFITPLIGAFLADACLGRYWTIASFSVIYVLGMVLLTMSASVPGLKPVCDDSSCHPKASQIVTFFVALYLIALATGGIKPCVSSFGADQFDETDETERKKKSSFFTWFYFAINIGSLLASTMLVWVQMNVNWGWGFGIPTVAMAIATMFFFSGSRLYRLQKPEGSPFTRIFQVMVASFRKFNVEVPADPSLLYGSADEEYSTQGCHKLDQKDKQKFDSTNETCSNKGATLVREEQQKLKELSGRHLNITYHNVKCPLLTHEPKGTVLQKMSRFFYKASVETEYDYINGLANPWRLCPVTQVDELQSILCLLPIWASGIVYSTVFGQISTMFVLQGNTMDQHIGPHFELPSASLSLFNTLSVLFWVPVYERVIVPCARRFTGHDRGFTQLQRMGIGLVISTFCMVAAGILEAIRLDMVRRNSYYDLKHVPMSIFWQVPAYFLNGCSEVFTAVGQVDFFYDQAPDSMRSMSSALILTTVALGNYLSTLLLALVAQITTRNGGMGWIPDNLNRGHLDYFFWLLAVLSTLNFFVYIWIAKLYRHKKDT